MVGSGDIWSSVVDRTACVDVPALPLQMLLRRMSSGGEDWRSQPVAVVDRDKPNGVLLWVNEAARRSRILPGMRYAAALSLESDLRAGVVSDEEIEEAVAELTGRLWHFSPQVEPSVASGNGDPGVFWLDASGILPLYRSFEEWGTCIRRELEDAAFVSTVAVGFTRFGSYAAARACGRGRVRARVAGKRGGRGGAGVIVFDSRVEEAAQVSAVPIDRLGFLPKLRDTLLELGVERLGQFLDLPAVGIRRRFGKDAHDLHALARSDAVANLIPVPLSEPLDRSLLFDRPEADLARLLAGIASLLAPLLQILERRQHAVRRVHIRLVLDDNSSVDEELDPAEATLDESQLLNLIELRLAGVALSAGVNEIHLDVTGVAKTVRQRDLFAAPPRDLAAAQRALARIRAEFGEASVVQAYLQEGHLPEARFGFATFGRLEVPDPTSVDARTMIRRCFSSPIPLPMRSKYEPDGWILDFADGPVEEVLGPYVIHGGWWLREVRRDYYYARTRNGRWLWLYHDRRRRRWFLQGEVE